MGCIAEASLHLFIYYSTTAAENFEKKKQRQNPNNIITKIVACEDEPSWLLKFRKDYLTFMTSKMW